MKVDIFENWWYISLLSLPMKSFLSYFVACDFKDFGIFECCSSWTSQFLPIHEKDEKLSFFLV